MPRTRAWTYTRNNYTDEHLVSHPLIPCVYHVFGKEIGEEKGTPHLQGFIYFKTVKSLEQVRKIFPGCHVEPKIKKSTFKEVSDYCKKDDDDFFEMGVLPDQGHRTDIDELMAKVSTTRDELEWFKVPAFWKFGKMADRFRKALDRKERKTRGYDMPKVYWYWGPSGSGKTRAAHELAGDEDNLYTQGMDGKWWDDYHGEEWVIIDDFDSRNWDYTNLMRILDGWCVSLPVKGATTINTFKHVIFTCIQPPELCWSASDYEKGMKRRIVEIKEFTVDEN